MSQVLVDVVHPGHVLFYRPILERLSSTLSVEIVSRRKDVTIDLLDEFGLDHVEISSQPKNKFGLVFESAVRLARIWYRLVRRRNVALLSRNPIGLLAARLSGTPAIFDTDNATSAGLHFKLSMALATHVTCPQRLELLGSRIHAYDALKPDSYMADAKVFRAELLQSSDFSEERPVLFIRLVSFGASHDVGHSGISRDLLRLLVEECEDKFRIVVSTEFDGRQVLGLGVELDEGPKREFHQRLARARVVLTDSGTVSQEAYLLGIPTIFVGSLAGNCEIQNSLAEKEQTFKVLSSSDDHQLIVSLVKSLSEGAINEVQNVGGELAISNLYATLISDLMGSK